MNYNPKFYQTVAWRRKRKQVLRRDEYLCQQCKRYGKRTPAKIVHHVLHYDEYPELGLTGSNLISLCEKCHNKEHPEKAAEVLRRVREYSRYSPPTH